VSSENSANTVAVTSIFCNIATNNCVKFLSMYTLLLYHFDMVSSSKYLVNFETPVIHRSMGWFSVFYAIRRNEGRGAET